MASNNPGSDVMWNITSAMLNAVKIFVSIGVNFTRLNLIKFFEVFDRKVFIKLL